MQRVVIPISHHALNYLLLSLCLLIVCALVVGHMCCRMSGVTEDNFWKLFLPFYPFCPRIDMRLSGLVANTFACWAVLPASFLGLKFLFFPSVCCPFFVQYLKLEGTVLVTMNYLMDYKKTCWGPQHNNNVCSLSTSLFCGFLKPSLWPRE